MIIGKKKPNEYTKVFCWKTEDLNDREEETEQKQ